ncbi:sialate:O-sulfotransferase 1-like [Saccostrea cucullata]|uniref:sialate:O-sulfotransferase 1-like n=1 Tax=Saccostrea cuccullata TaxID=36930 RepID=UPI002ED28D2F
MNVCSLVLFLSALCASFNWSGANSPLQRNAQQFMMKRYMDYMLRDSKWNWKHKKTYAIVKTGMGFADIDVVSKYRLEGLTSVTPRRPPRPELRPPRPMGGKKWRTRKPKPPPKPETPKPPPPPKPVTPKPGVKKSITVNRAGMLGCYQDSKRRVFSGRPMLSKHMTVGRCKQRCAGEKKKFYGLQHANECYCGNTMRFKISKPMKECMMKCKGSNEACGGPWRLLIYRNPKYPSSGDYY